MDTHPEIDLLSQANEAVQLLMNHVPRELQQPSIGIICGSGLGCLAEAILPNLIAEVPYSEIPHFPINTSNFPREISRYISQLLMLN